MKHVEITGRSIDSIDSTQYRGQRELRINVAMTEDQMFAALSSIAGSVSQTVWQSFIDRIAEECQQ